LLIVVLIIGILAVIALPQYQLARDKAKYSSTMDLTKSIASANERYYLATGSYTKDFTGLDIDLPYTAIEATNSGIYFNWGYCYFNAGASGGCRITSGFDAMYMYNGKVCYAETADERAKRVCKAMTGNYTGGIDGIWTVYIFK
jgi:type II secretory pathway pseudopilin PulG